jgi:3-isopropylmalate dehydrogenase
VIRGDGIGPEVIDASLEVLGAAQSVFGFRTELTQISAGAQHYLATGELWTPALQAQLRDHDAILFGAMGDPAVAPGILERGFILEMRRSFQQAVNLRPVKLYPGVTTPIAGLTPERCDIVIVRENTEGSYVGRGSTVHAGTPHAVAVQESVNTRMGVEPQEEHPGRSRRPLAVDGRRRECALPDCSGGLRARRRPVLLPSDDSGTL